MWNIDTFKPLVYAAEDALRADIGARPYIVEVISYPEFLEKVDNGEDEITLALARSDYYITEKVIFNPYSLGLSIWRDSETDTLLSAFYDRHNVYFALQEAIHTT